MVVELLIQGSASTMKILRIAGFYVLLTLTQYAKRDWVRGWLAERLRWLGIHIPVRPALASAFLGFAVITGPKSVYNKALG
jgi:hypothetical protein